MQRKLSTSLLLALLFAGILMVGLKVSSVSATHFVDGVISPGEYSKGMAVQLVGRTDPNWTVAAYIDWDAEYLYVALNESVPATTKHLSWIEFAMDPGSNSSYLYAFVLFDDHVQTYDTYVKPSGTWAGQGSGNFSAVSNVATEFAIKYSDYGIALGDSIKMSIDRNMGPPPPAPYGFAAYWPQNATVYDGSPVQAVPTTWGDVYLSPQTFGHVVDGIITQGEYDTGTAVQLVGRTDPNWTVAAYIDWDAEYLYVAVNESVPTSTALNLDWIEFAIDPGPNSSYLYAFVLFGTQLRGYDVYAKPSGIWMGLGTGNFTVVTGVATEFKVKYTDYGIAPGDTIKMSIDRNMGPPPPAPYGFAAYWPQNATVYDGSPVQAVPTTWGDITLVQHDIEVTNLAPIKTIIAQGYSGNINVTVGNPGGYSENFDVTLYANQTMIATPTSVNLANGSIATLTLIWNTTGFAIGSYFINATAGSVPGELNTTNNALKDGQVVVTVPGDLNGDFKVNLVDLVTLALAYGSKPGDTRWNPNADLDNNAVVGLIDLVILANHYGQQYP